MLCAAKRCNSTSFSSEGNRPRRAAWSTLRLALARAADVGKAWRSASAEGRFGILADLRELRKQLVADGRQLVLSLGAFRNELLAVLHHPLQLGGGLSRRRQAPHCLQRVSCLYAFLQGVVEMIRQAQRVAFVRFEQASLPLLHMHKVDRNIQLLQVLHQGFVIVAGHLQ